MLPWVELVMNLRDGAGWKSFQPLCLHLLTNQMPFVPACVVHMMYNYVSSLPASCGSKFSNFVSTYYWDHWANRHIELNTDFGVETYTPEEALLPKQEAYCPIPQQCDLLVFKDRKHPIRNTRLTFFHSIITVNFPCYPPQSSDHTLQHTVLCRIGAAPPLQPLSQAKAWEEIYSILDSIHQHPPLFYEDIVGGWFDHLDAKKQRKYQHAYHDLLEYGPQLCDKDMKHTKVFIKTDEFLMKREGSQLLLKPRLIANISVNVQILVGPYIYACQKRLTKIWSFQPQPFRWNGINYFLTYAGSSTDHQLTAWYSFVQESLQDDEAYIIVCGDDSLVATQINGIVTYYEGDARMFDQSQSLGPLGFEYEMLEKLGIPPEITDILYSLASNTYMVNMRNSTFDFTVNKRDRPMRDTGGTDTSVGNSIVMACAWVAVINKLPQKLEESFLQLGIDIKLKAFPDIRQATFLKGMWYFNTQGVAWGPLPSRFLKVGKSLNDPRTIYHIPDPTKAATRYLYDVAGGYSYFLQVPLIRRFVQQYFNGDHSAIGIVYRPQFSVRGDSIPIVFDAWTQLQERYDITQQEFEETEKLILNTPFCYLQSPVFFKLAIVDYA